MDPMTELDRIVGQLGPEAIDPWLEAAFGDDATPPATRAAPDQRTTASGVTHTARCAPWTPCSPPPWTRRSRATSGLATGVPLDEAGIGRRPTCGSSAAGSWCSRADD